jgi:hypothetical protein
MFDSNQFSKTMTSGVARYITGNAFKPILLLCLIAIPSFLAAAYLFKDDRLVSCLLLIAATIPMVLACVVYVCFAYYKPEKLQSETYQLRQQAMQLVEQKGKGFAVSPVSLEAISNPAIGLLGTGEEPERR